MFGNRHKAQKPPIANQHEPGRTAQILDQWIGDDGTVIFKINSNGVITGSPVSGSVLSAVTTVATSSGSISKAEILTLNTVGKELVADPGAGYVLEFVSLVLIHDFGVAAYTGGGTVNVLLGSVVVSNVISAANSFSSSADCVAQCVALDTANGLVLTAGGALVLKANTGDFTDPGTAVGTGRFYITYKTHATGL